MPRALLLLVLLPLYAETAGPVREMVYPQAIGGRIMPRYDKGYLIYVEHPNHIDIHGPDGLRYFESYVDCPGGGTCSTSDAALNSRGEIAVGMSYSGPKGYRGAIRIFDRKGAEIRLIETGLYLPGRLAYDKTDSLWTLGWQRDASQSGREEESDYALVRKYSPGGKEVGQTLQRSLWPRKGASPGSVSFGYWMIEAAADRVGAVIHEYFADRPAEWLEWDLDGKLLSRTEIPSHLSMGRAYAADGQFSALFTIDQRQQKFELRVLDVAMKRWTAVESRHPEHTDAKRSMLLGAQGKELVYLIPLPGFTRLLVSAPGEK